MTNTRDTAEDMRLRIDKKFRRFDVRFTATKASGQVHNDGDARIPGFMREDKYRSVKGWSISHADMQKAKEQALRQGLRLLFVVENKDNEAVVVMPLEQFAPILAIFLEES